MLENNNKEKEIFEGNEENLQEEHTPQAETPGEEMPQEEMLAPEQQEAQEEYEEPTWEEEHEDVPDVVDGGSTAESLQEEAEHEQQEKMLTQSQVNDLVGRARQEGRMSAVKELLERYGVGDENELNDMFGRGQAYESLNDEYTNQGKMYNDVRAENALLKSHIDDSRWEDVKLILGGKGLEVSEENIQALLPSHPEWKAQSAPEMPSPVESMMAPQDDHVQPSIMHKLGEDASPKNDEMSEEEQVRKWYGI